MIVKFFVLTLAALFVPYVVPGARVKGLESALCIAFVFGVLNFFIGGLLHWFLVALSFPFVVLTLGLFVFVITVLVNAILLKITGAALDSFELDGWMPAFGMGFLFALAAKAAEWIA